VPVLPALAHGKTRFIEEFNAFSGYSLHSVAARASIVIDEDLRG